MADYWMKLYVELLDDPKMALLPDRLWRRTIEVMLVAKKMGNDGKLPETRQIAWLLRMNADDLQQDLEEISVTGIVVPDGNGWFVPNFAKRQAATPDVDRKAHQRDRDKSRQYHEPVTSASRSVTQSTEHRVQSTEADADAEAERETAFPNADSGEWEAGPPPPPAPADPENFEGMSVRQAERVAEIQTVIKATGWMPGKPVWRLVVETIRANRLSEKTIKDCYTTWCARGFKRDNIAWLTEWAVQGIPQPRAPAPVPARNGKPGPADILAAMAEAERQLQ